MRTINHPSITIPAWDETVYSYDDLDQGAKDRAFSDWCESYAHGMYYVVRDEIFDALNDFCEKTGNRYDTDSYDRMWFTTRDRWDTGFHYAPQPEHVEDTGICYSMDICDLWDETAAGLASLYDSIENAANETQEDACRTAYDRAYRAALDRIAAKVNRMVSDEFDYWYCDNCRDTFEYDYAHDNEYNIDGSVWHG